MICILNRFWIAIYVVSSIFVCHILSLNYEKNILLNKEIINKCQRAQSFVIYFEPQWYIDFIHGLTDTTNQFYSHTRFNTFCRSLFPDIFVWKGRLQRLIESSRMAHVQTGLSTAVCCVAVNVSVFSIFSIFLSCVCILNTQNSIQNRVWFFVDDMFSLLENGVNICINVYRHSYGHRLCVPMTTKELRSQQIRIA